jgi:lysophospholipase L1-like esterase
MAEAAVRAFAPQETMFPRWVYSPEYPLALPPNTTVVHSRGRRWRFEYTTNGLGRRGSYVAPDATAGQRVVSLGDSFTFGVGLNDGEVYTDVLGRLLGSGYSVVNGGMGGFGLDSEVKWFFREGAVYDPQIVTLQFTANDPFDFYGVTRVEDSELTFHPNPRSRPTWQLLLSGSGVIQKSHLYGVLKGLFTGRAVQGQVGVGSTAVPEERYAELLRRFAEEVEERGAILLFVSVTHRESAGPVAYHYDVDDFPIIRGEVNRLADEGLLHFVELPTEEMSRHPGSPEGHQWGAEHHRLVAGAIAAKIVELDEARGRDCSEGAASCNGIASPPARTQTP